MDVNSKTALIQEICKNKGLSGVALAEYEKRLANLSESELFALLNGGNTKDLDKGVTIEHKSEETERSNTEIYNIEVAGTICEAEVKYNDSGYPISRIERKGNEILREISYEWVTGNNTEPAHVLVTETTPDGGKRVTTALNVNSEGEINDNDFIYTQKVNPDGSTETAYSLNGVIIEDKVRANGKKITTLYNGTSYNDYTQGDLHRVVQQVERDGKIYFVEYDGKGNTKTTVQNGESPALIAQKFNVSTEALKRLNPQKGKNAINQVGAQILVPGEFNADSAVVRRRLSASESIQKYNKQQFKDTLEHIYTSNIEEKVLTKNYDSNYWALAKELLGPNASNQQINDKALELEVLNSNNNTKLTKGSKIYLTGEHTDVKTVQELKKLGFPATSENFVFYNKFNKLNNAEKQNVLRLLKYMNSQKVTDPRQIKAAILRSYPTINLFDSDKTIPQRKQLVPSGFSTPVNDSIALETFIQDYLGISLDSEAGKNLYERMNNMSQAELNKLSATEMKQVFKNLKATGFSANKLEELRNVFSNYGVDIRSASEQRADYIKYQQSPKYEEDQLRRMSSEGAGIAYDQAISLIKQYQDSQGWLNIGYWREKLGGLLDLITPGDNHVAMNFDGVIRRLERQRDYVKSVLNTCSGNEKEYKAKFKELTGVDYNPEKVKKFISLADKNDPSTSEAYVAAFGTKVTDAITDQINYVQGIDMVGDIAGMLIGTSWIKELGAMKSVAGGTANLVGRMGLGNTATMNLTRGLVGAEVLGTWTAGSGAINNLTKASETTSEDWKNLGVGTLVSAGFGFVGGISAESLSKIERSVSDYSKKLLGKTVPSDAEAMSKILSSGKNMNGVELWSKFIDKTCGANLAGKSAKFAAEVALFTGYDINVEIIKDIVDENGNLKEVFKQEGSIEKYLLGKLKDQTTNLGLIKTVGHFIEMRLGGKYGQALSDYEVLKRTNVKQLEVNGIKKYIIEVDNGNRIIADSPAKVLEFYRMSLYTEALAKNNKFDGAGSAKQNDSAKPGQNLIGNNLGQKTIAKADETVAPFAKRLTRTPDIKDLTNPEVKKVNLENGEFDSNGNFVSDGTHFETETGNPLAKGKLFKDYPDGKRQIAQNFEELATQIASPNGTQKLEKSEKLRLKKFLEEHPEINVQDLSEIISDYCHAMNTSSNRNINNFLFGYDGISLIKDLQNFKKNIAEFDKFISDLKTDEANSQVVDKFQNMRNEFLSKEMTTINPEDFKKNLDFYKSLSPDIKKELIHYDFDIVLKPQSEEIIDRIKFANDYDKWLMEQGKFSTNIMAGRFIRHWRSLSTEEFNIAKENVELAKEMLANNYENNNFISYIIDSRLTDIKKLCSTLKTELGEDFDYTYIDKLLRFATNPGPAITLIKNFPKETKNLSAWNIETIIGPYYSLDENGKKNFLAKIAIAGKMPQLVSHYDNSFSTDLLKQYLAERNIPDADKILEFVNLADPQFLRKINFRRYNSTPAIDFEQIFKPENLDNMIECAKLHKELPQEFLDYLHSDESIVSQNRWYNHDNSDYQYNISPEELSARIARINKYKDKFPPKILEKIYNGMATGKESTFEALSQIDPEFADRLISYNIHSSFDEFPPETLQKFIEYTKNSEITEQDIQNFCYGYAHPGTFEIFDRFNEEELDAISFKSMAQNGYKATGYTLDHIQKTIHATPKIIRDVIKNDVHMSFYSDYMKTSEHSDYPDLITCLNGFSEADLKNIGPKVLIKYLDQSYNPKKFNPENLEQWKSISQDAKDKLGEDAFYILTDTNTFDPKEFNRKIQYLKDKNVFDEIQQSSLYKFIQNTSPEMEKCLDDIISSTDFNTKDINYLIYNLSDIRQLENPDWDFVKELISNPKVKAKDIPEILSPLNKQEPTRNQQKDFARYLIARGDLEAKDIKNLLYKIAWHEPDLNNERIRFAKELLDNPNVAKSDVEGLIKHLNIETYAAEEKLILNMINAKHFPVETINTIFENISNAYERHCQEKYEIVGDLIEDNRYETKEICNIIHSLWYKNEPDILSLARKFIKNLEEKNFNAQEIIIALDGLSNEAKIAARQIKFANELANNKNFDRNYIGATINPCRNDAIENFARELIDNQKIDNNKIYIILNMIIEQNANIQTDIAREAIETKNYEPQEIASLIDIVNRNKTIAPDILAGKIKDFISTGIDASLIQDICNNAKAISIFNNDVVNILKRLKENNANVQQVVELISDGTIPIELGKKIDVLLTLAQFTPEDKAILRKQGIDLDARIQTIMLAIDKKYPTIETSQENILDFLKHISNAGNSDAVIRNADFAQFGKDGIPLQYTRDNFMHNMDNIIARGGLSERVIPTTNAEIPELKLSNEDIQLTKEKIQSLASGHKQEEVEVIFEDGPQKGIRFLGTQGGSNKAYYTKVGDKLYYIKYPRTEKLGQSVEEVIASRLYRAAGIDAPNMKYIYNEDGKIIGMAGEYVPNLSATPKEKSHFTEGFAADAWLANWDAPKNDNTQYRESGVIKVDVGGSLRYRARGEMKEFSSIVNEISTLIEQNSQFMSMTKEELLASLKHVTETPDAIIKKIIDESPLDDNRLINTLIKRKEYLTIFAKNLEILDETQFKNILEMVNEAKRMTTEEFKDDVNIAEQLGYYRTKTGFEGLLNTTGTRNLALQPQQQETVNQMIAEIEKFTKENRISDDIEIEAETRDFLNAILKGVPEFAAFFGKPQHDKHDYSLDVHILKVLQESLNDPLYQQLDDTSKIVLKFSTLLHDIGKKYLIEGSDTGHAEKSAEYVYSILDRFNLSKDIKDRIISIIENHHWFKAYNLKDITPSEIATLCRRPEDFLIYQIMAKADLKSVNDKFYLEKTEASTLEEADRNFAKKMAEIQPYVETLSEKQVVITPSKFVKVPERVTSSGKVLQAREFPKETVLLNGVETEFEVLNLSNMDMNTNMFQYGFNNIALKDLRLLVHMVLEKINLEVFKTLAQNPMNNSAQSLSMISMDDKSTYCDLTFGFIVDVDNANIAHAYFSNTSSGTKKGFKNFVSEMFENSEHRSFVKNKFLEYFKQRNCEISDKEYAAITRYIRKKQYPETQIKGLKIGDRVFSKEDLIGAFTYSRDKLISEKKMKAHGMHNEIVGLNAQIKGLIAKVSSLKECPDWFLEFARDNNLPIILVGK